MNTSDCDPNPADEFRTAMTDTLNEQIAKFDAYHHHELCDIYDPRPAEEAKPCNCWKSLLTACQKRIQELDASIKCWRCDTRQKDDHSNCLKCGVQLHDFDGDDRVAKLEAELQAAKDEAKTATTIVPMDHRHMVEQNAALVRLERQLAARDEELRALKEREDPRAYPVIQRLEQENTRLTAQLADSEMKRQGLQIKLDGYGGLPELVQIKHIKSWLDRAEALLKALEWTEDYRIAEYFREKEKQ